MLCAHEGHSRDDVLLHIGAQSPAQLSALLLISTLQSLSTVAPHQDIEAHTHSSPGCAGLWEHQEGSLGGPCCGAAGGAMTSAPLSMVIHPLAPQLLPFPPSAGVGRGGDVCRAKRDPGLQGCGLASVQIHTVAGTGLAGVALDQWTPGLGCNHLLVRETLDRR